MNEHRGLWRGKLKYDTKPYMKGEWIEGNYIQLDDNTSAILPHIYGYGEVEVISDTLGECTGSTDKNSKLAFEGDLVKVEYIAAIGVIRYGEYRQPFNEHNSTKHIGFYIDWLGESNKAYLRVDLGYWLQIVEIIGNIHDTPELIQKGAAE